jgi:hypothetical protein
MSNLNLENNLLEDVSLFYTKVKTPSLKYQSTTEKEYSVNVLVDKTTAKAWNKKFPKQKAKEVDREDFVEKFGEEFAIGDEEQYFIVLKKPAQYKDGNPLKENQLPRAFMDDGSGNLEDITFTKLIGNGSKGVVQFDVTSNDFGTFAKLAGIRVDELVAVEQVGGEAKYNVLGKVKSLAEAPEQSKPKQEVEIAEDDDSVPF